VTRTRNEALIRAGLVLAAILTVLVAAAAYRTTEALRTTVDWVAHTQETQAALADLLSTLQQVEAGERGYVITGDRRFVEEGAALNTRVTGQLANLRRLTADDAVQQQRLGVLDDLVARKIALAQRVIDLRAESGFAAAAAVIATEEGRKLIEAIDSLVVMMHGEESDLLAQRSAALRASERSTLLAFSGFAALAFGLLGFVYVVVRRDLAERSRAEANLRGLLEAAPDATLVLGEAGQIAMVNAQVPVLFGYDRDELLGQPVEVLLPERFRTAHVEHRSGYLRDPRARPMGAGLQLYAATREGREFPVEISLSPLRTESGMLVTAAVRDITDRKRAEEALRQAAAQIRDLYDRAPCGYHSLGPDGTFLEINDTELSWLGRRRDEVVGRMKFSDVLAAESAQRFEREYPEFIRRGWVRDVEFECLRRDGSVLPVLLNATAITDSAGRYVCSRSTMIDLSERQRAEHLLIERQTLARTNKELQEFAYVASHDLQEPLRKIQAFGDRLRTKYAAALPEQAGDYLRRMQNAAARMQTLINDLLSFSRVTTRAQPFVPVDLAAIARDVVSDLEGRLEETHGRVALAALPTIEADPTQMRQLLQNLLSNALKFHRPDVAPSVHVSARLLNGDSRSPPAQPAGESVCELSVADNGIGFDEKYLDRIFTIFQRLHGRAQYEGTGLGLAICRKIVQRHRGQITAHSTPGQGATFVVTLPVQQAIDEVRATTITGDEPT
jgi:two-component system sensor kinase FixL